MSDLQTLRSNIATYLARDDLNTEIDRAINRAIAHYTGEQFWFTEANDTFSTVDGQSSYSSSDGLASDIASIHTVTLATTSNYKYTLIPRTFKYIRDVNTSGDNYKGHSYDYSWFEEKLWLYPTPDQAYTITVYYFQNYSDLSANADSNDFTVNAQDLIEARASWWVASRLLQDNDKAVMAKQDELEALSSLRGRHSSLVSSGRIRATHF